MGIIIRFNQLYTLYFDAFLFIDERYERHNERYCSPYYSQYSTLSEAERQCSDKASCTMLYDAEGKGIEFRLCDIGAEIEISALHSILYVKKREYIFICTSF